ncbi:FUSC family protein [Chitinibacter sp. SCUT-21]|uniref:FUSC family protein n=1 Tax=Chitinibacter sp. SCUT-21 TaxID=2970891 RepID=UPI0035A6AF01
MSQWISLVKPAGKPFHRSRMILGAMAFGFPMAWFISNGNSQHAAFAGFGILASLFMDIGSTRQQRLESMLLGNALILLAAGVSLYLNDHWLIWLCGVVLLFSILGRYLAAGFALDMKLRMLATAYLIGYPGTSISAEILPLYLVGAIFTMALSTIFAPRINNPIALAHAPHWRLDWQNLRAGQHASQTFGVFLAIACASSFFTAHAFHLHAPNLAAATTLMVFRPEPSSTQTTIWLRIFGVLIASVAAWALVFPAHSHWHLLLAAIAAGSLIPIAFANGLMYVAALMTFIIYVILALMGIQGRTAQIFAEMRIIETLIGAFFAAFFAMTYEILNSKQTP